MTLNKFFFGTRYCVQSPFFKSRALVEGQVTDASLITHILTELPFMGHFLTESVDE